METGQKLLLYGVSGLNNLLWLRGYSNDMQPLNLNLIEECAKNMDHDSETKYLEYYAKTLLETLYPERYILVRK